MQAGLEGETTLTPNLYNRRIIHVSSPKDSKTIKLASRLKPQTLHKYANKAVKFWSQNTNHLP